MSKQNQLLDAVKTAKSIHEGDYSSLRDKSFVIRDNIKKNKRRGKNVNKHNNGKMTLAKLAQEMRDGFKQVNARIDGIDTRLDNLEKDVKDINTRLDYNGLKKLPNKYIV